MSKRYSKVCAIEITKTAYNRLIAYGLSNHEFVALLAGSKNRITAVFKIPNRSSRKRHFAEWSDRDEFFVRRAIKQAGLTLIAHAHSHPAPEHKPKISVEDFEHTAKGTLELLVHSHSMSVTAWLYRSTLKETLARPLQIKIV